MATQKSFTKKQIVNAINSQMADNTSQAITASNVRSITKDYMTGSMAAPMLIYAGQITSGATAADCIVREQYYNPDFFQLQNTTSPASASNIFQANTTSFAGMNDTYVVTGVNGLAAVITISNGSLTDMVIIDHLGGFIVGDVITMLLNGNQIGLTLTYNGAIRPQDPTGGISITETYFKLTENSDNTYEKHTNINTIVSAANKNLSVGTSMSFQEKNEILYGYSDSLAIFSSKTEIYSDSDTDDPQVTTTYKTQHIQLYRLPGTQLSRSGY
tara:strand:+ start:284 stop:1099 length:816 start_codon:yes stop_codon:yes gene_type:complete